MSPDVKIFLAALASTPVLSLAILVMAMLTSDEIVFDIIYTLQVWLVITVILAVAVLAVGGMYFVWTWAL